MGRLHRLVDASRHDEVKDLLERGVDVDEVVDNLTPLELAIHNGDVAMVALLIRAGADVNHGHPLSGVRPLDGSVTQPDLRIMELLLDAGADVEGCRETSTPLCTAAAFRKQKAFDRLIAAGANPNATRKGKTAHEILESSIRADALFKNRSEQSDQYKKTDLYAEQIKKMMTEYPTVEEYAAHKGRNIYMFSLDKHSYNDPDVAKWAKDLGEILHSRKRLEQCEEQYLSGADLEAAHRRRKQLERWQAREKRRKERIEKADFEKLKEFGLDA